MPMTRTRVVFTVVVALSSAACSSSVATTSTSTAPAPASSSLQPVGYKPQFGTMWTFDAPPLEYWKKTYGFAPDQAWLDNARLASVRTPNCSASFVSAKGLVLTNHHCVRACEDAVSPKDINYVETGYAAALPRDERKCPDMWADQLESIQNVTQRVSAGVTSSDANVAAQQRTA